MHTEVDEINRVFKSRSRFHSGRVVNLTLIPGKSVLRIRLGEKKRNSFKNFSSSRFINYFPI